MPRDEGTLPEEGLLLCESCGYILAGLSPDSRCPECAKPISDSAPDLRQLPEWERADTGRSAPSRFCRTTAAIILHPARFCRALATRAGRDRSRAFARIHRLLATLLLGITAALHLLWMLGAPTWADAPQWATRLAGSPNPRGIFPWLIVLALAIPPCSALTWLFLAGTTRLAARLTAWEARYRKFRLPLDVVLRGLDYHSAQLLPVALVAFLTVAGYQLLLAAAILDDLSGQRYLFLLCAEVLFAAAWLFKTYWAAMRQMLYANR